MTTPVLKEYFLKLVRSPFSRNVIIASSGSVIAQAITILFSPLVSRIYGAEAFGLLGTFTALVAVLTPIAALTYPIAIVLPKNDNDAKGIASLSMRIALIICLLVSLGLLIGNDKILALLNADSIHKYIWLVPITMLFATWLQTAQQWLFRKKQFMVAARVTVTKTIISSIAKVSIGWFHPLASVLIVITVIDNFLYALLLNLGIKRKEGVMLSGKRTSSKTSLRDLAIKHKDFPLYRSPIAFVNAASQHLPVLLLASLFGPASAGFYVLGIRILSIPSEIIGRSVGNVFYPRINEASNSGENLTRLIVKATLALAAIGCIPFAVVIVFGPVLFGFVFGSEWIEAGVYARWMTFMLFFMFINKPAIAAVPVLNVQRGYMIYGFITAAIKLATLYIGFIIFKSDTKAVALFSVVGAISYVFLIIWVILSSKKKPIQDQIHSDQKPIKPTSIN